MNQNKNKKKATSKRYLISIGSGVVLQTAIILSGTALADINDSNFGVIDRPVTGLVKLDDKELTQQVKLEEVELAKQDRGQLKDKAENGERLAQVALGSDFAKEAQLLTFAPAAANDAQSDALRWYAAAAKRGYPGAPSLDASGVSFHPVRVVRNK